MKLVPRGGLQGPVSPAPDNAWWCTNCDEGILEPAMLAERERIFVELRAETDQVFLPERVAAIRRKLGISQREASKVLGGGANAFQRYESGQVPVSDAMKIYSRSSTMTRVVCPSSPQVKQRSAWLLVHCGVAATLARRSS